MKSFLAPTIPLTIIIEGLILWLWCQAANRKFLPLLVTLTLANLLTQALLISALAWSPFPYWPTLLTMEVVILLIESGILTLTRLPWRRAVSLSLLVNLASFGFGLLLPY